MNSYLVYRASFYVMLVVANMALVGDSADGQFAIALHHWPWRSAGAVAFFTVDLTGGGPCRDRLANALGVATLGVLYLEYKV